MSLYISGPTLPLRLAGPAMVTSPTGKGVIAITPMEFSKSMFELSQSMEWTKLEQTLKIDHWAPLVIPIPAELVSRKDWK